MEIGPARRVIEVEPVSMPVPEVVPDPVVEPEQTPADVPGLDPADVVAARVGTASAGD